MKKFKNSVLRGRCKYSINMRPFSVSKETPRWGCIFDFITDVKPYDTRSKFYCCLRACSKGIKTKVTCSRRYSVDNYIKKYKKLPEWL